MQRKPLRRCASLSAGIVLAIALPAQAAFAECLTKQEMRAMTITLADLAAEQVVEHCTSIDGAQTRFMDASPQEVTAHFDALRPDATTVLINKYAPFLASRRSIAEQTVEPILKLIIDQFALDKMTAQSCMEMDMTFEALSTLEPDASATMLTVFMARGAEMDDEDTPFKLCKSNAGQ